MLEDESQAGDGWLRRVGWLPPFASVSVGADSNERRSEDKEKARPKPHLFFVLVDDMGWNDIGYQSTDLQAVTPNLNSLAKRGVTVCVRFLRACVCCRGTV